MFDKAKNLVIRDSTFSMVVNTESLTSPILQPLLDRVSLNAILNTGGRADEVGCYPGTRDMVIGKLERWMDSESDPDHRMFWLSGPAGAGKSAIMQTVAERCKERGTHAANFFFFRGDGSRNTSQPLVATLVYQLLDFHPALYEHLKDCLSAKPLTYKASTKEQFIQFISSPFKVIQQSSSMHLPIVLIIDGLDECSESDKNNEEEDRYEQEQNKNKQEEILGSLHALVSADSSPFRVLVASRAEHHLKMAFNKIQTSVRSIFLDGTDGSDDDIRHFVIAKFDEIRQLHPLSHTLSKDWPTKEDIDAITNKSSGQFIYAATVMRFIQYSSSSPALSLLTVHGMRPSAGHHPLAHLNAVYSYIFSRVQDIHTIKLVLCLHLIIADFGHFNDLITFAYLADLVGYSPIEIQSYFADLAAIIRVTTDPDIALVFYHASLTDYLIDKSQSGIYCVDVGEISRELSLICLKKFHDYESLRLTLVVLDCVSNSTAELSNLLSEASTRQLQKSANQESLLFHRLTSTLERLYLTTDRALFKRLLRDWIRFAFMHNIHVYWEPDLDITSARWYYKWRFATERVKCALRLSG